jgi:hypothetical protein
VRLTRRSRRRAAPHLVVGALLVLACALGFVMTSLRASGRLPVLALARSVPAGHALTAADLRITQVAADVGTGVLPAADRDGVLGRAVAVPRPAGSLLFRGDIGPAAFPPRGQAVAAVAVKAGQYPPGLSVGSRVAVLTGQTGDAAPAGGGPGDRGRHAAAVVEVSPGAADGAGSSGAVVSLLMAEGDADAAARAAAAGQVSLVLLSPAGGGGA